MNTMIDLTELTQKQTRPINCHEHGQQLETGYMGRWFGCPVCADIASKKQQEAEKLEQQREFFAAMNLPELFKNSGLAGYKITDARQQPVIARLREYVEEIKTGSSKNLILAGATGTGKTHLACAILRNIAHFNIRCRYVFSADFSAQIRASWDAKTRTKFESEVIDYFGSVPVLLIDDFGVNDLLKSDIWSALFDQRYRENKPTIITTNLDEVELVKMIGDRAADRVLPKSLWANCVWGSYRRVSSSMERI
ncbi:ATP-binding protein [Alkanindiges illinoisensis]|uniref:ATP-binding protein n=1 Tax=Alkanindiges illinoisensis TaxID=197183 RepID=A0A4Y7X927_9GAMM|nr:ATP-binding protein [Alkanindiges illinoisensis]TEU23353.1 ATP-binding protein [Alkanindiges illinoisensis]